MQGWSPLGKGTVLNEEVLVRIAKAHKATTAQVAIAWSLQMEVPTVVKSTKVKRVWENWASIGLVLDQDEMEDINLLHKDVRVSWDPSSVP